jgi:hypothetical protein
MSISPEPPQNDPEVSKETGQLAPPLSAGSLRWAVGVMVALVLGGGIGTLLGYLALLPFFVGLFFFLLLGLAPGAVLFRFGHPLRPMSLLRIWSGALPVVLVTFSVAVYVEYRALPRHVAVKVRKNVSGFPAGYTRAALENRAAEMVGNYLRRRYGSDDLLAYIRWASRSGRIEIPQGPFTLRQRGSPATQPAVTLQLNHPAVHQLQQPGALWSIRVAASFVMLCLAMALQLGPLRKPDPNRQ